MAIDWTVEKLAELNPVQRHQLWLNAMKREAVEVVLAIESSGLSYSDPRGVKLESPLGRAMAKIISSPEGKAAAIGATQKGMPALAGIDPILKSRLGSEYIKSYEATIQAGYLVAKMMQKAGYEKSHQAPLPAGCVAKTGLVYRTSR